MTVLGKVNSDLDALEVCTDIGTPSDNEARMSESDVLKLPVLSAGPNTKGDSVWNMRWQVQLDSDRVGLEGNGSAKIMVTTV